MQTGEVRTIGRFSNPLCPDRCSPPVMYEALIQNRQESLALQRSQVSWRGTPYFSAAIPALQSALPLPKLGSSSLLAVG